MWGYLHTGKGAVTPLPVGNRGNTAPHPLDQTEKHAVSVSVQMLLLRTLRIRIVRAAGSVGSQNLLNPGHELRHAGVHSRRGGGAKAAAPGHDAHQSPGSILLTDQGAARVTLQEEKGLCPSLNGVSRALVCLAWPRPGRMQRNDKHVHSGRT